VRARRRKTVTGTPKKSTSEKGGMQPVVTTAYAIAAYASAIAGALSATRKN
jgi:hypothetical protein